MQQSIYQNFSQLPTGDGERSWIIRKRKLVIFSIIVALFVCLGVWIYNSQDNESTLATKEFYDAGRELQELPPLEVGKEYNFNIEAKCACGAGEGRTPDLYFKLFECKNGGGYNDWGKTGVNMDNAAVTFYDAFRLKYNPDAPSQMYLELWDLDDFKDDMMATTGCFDPFVTSVPSIYSEEDIAKCVYLGSGCALTSFGLYVWRNS